MNKEKKGKFGNFAIQYINRIEIFCGKTLILGIFAVLVLVEAIK